MVTGEQAERHLPAWDREVLSLESGANDGLALPVVLAALALAGPLTAAEAISESLWQVLGAVVLSGVVGWVGGRALRAGESHGATAHGPALFFTVVLALSVLGLSGLTHTDGILAVFVGGLVFNLVRAGEERTSELTIDKGVNRFAVLPLFVALGRPCRGRHGATSAGPVWSWPEPCCSCEDFRRSSCWPARSSSGRVAPSTSDGSGRSASQRSSTSPWRPSAWRYRAKSWLPARSSSLAAR